MKIIRIDASSLKNSACFLKFWRTCVEGYRSKQVNISAEFGSAVHIFIKEFTEGKSFDISFAMAAKYFIERSKDPFFKIPKGKEYLTVGHLELVCQKYSRETFRFSPIIHKGEVLVEKNFEIPFYETEHVSIRLTGTIDILGQIQNGCYCIGDYKTTSSWQQDVYLQEFESSLQLPFYLLAIQTMAQKYPESIFADMTQKPIGCFIYGIFLHKEKIAEFKQSDVWFFEEWRISQLRDKVMKLAMDIAYLIEKEQEPLPDGLTTETCSGKYGHACEFLGACLRPKASALVLQNNFVKHDYNPLNFRKL